MKRCQILSIFIILLSILCPTTQTISQTVELDGELKLIGENHSMISNSGSANREILQIRAVSDAFDPGSDGAGINLYGDGDNVNPGQIILFTGGADALRVTNNQTVQISNEIEYIGNNGDGAGANGLIQKNASSGRDELQLYADGDAFSTGSKGSGIHLYGNFDNEHAGNIALLTGNSGSGNARMIIAGGGGIGPHSRNLTDTRVTIGNDIFNWVDDKNDTGMLNLKNPQGRPAIYITSTGASEGEIAIPNGEAFNIGQWNGSVFSSKLEIDGSGNVGIATTTPGFKLEVNGSAGKPGGGSWSTASDRRLKQEISEYKRGLAEILQIRPVKYRYNALSGYNTEQEHIGVLAQELQEVTPEMVSLMNGSGKDYLQVDNSAMTYMLINAIQEQQQMINSLREEVSNLQLALEQQ